MPAQVLPTTGSRAAMPRMGRVVAGTRVKCSQKNVKSASRSAALMVRATAAPQTPAQERTFTPGDAKTVGAIILGGGAGTRLYPLTKTRAKPAVPIGGAYRLIDVPMSNCLNCGINKIYILTQFNSTSLNRHLSKTYNLQGSVAGQGFVEVLAATQTPLDTNWFQGTADAVRQYGWIFGDIKNREMEDVVILSGDHLYRMDYMKFVDYHRQSGADVTIGCLPCTEEDATGFGLMKIDDDANIVEFSEKPKGDALQAMRVDTTTLGCTPEEAAQKPFIASMGIYVFKRKALLDLLNDNPDDNDFGGEVIPRAAREGMNVKAFLFNGYWEDIGTIKSFFEANLALAHDPPRFEFFDPDGPIVTSPRFLPPAKVMKSKVTDAIIAHGAFVDTASIENAIVGLRSRELAISITDRDMVDHRAVWVQINKDVKLQDAMIMGADYYESESQREALLAQGKVPIGVGEGSVIQNAIIDKNARIGKNVTIANKAGIDEANCEEQGYFIRSGIVVVLANATIPDGMEI